MGLDEKMGAMQASGVAFPEKSHTCITPRNDTEA